jgi:hypothetical protein
LLLPILLPVLLPSAANGNNPLTIGNSHWKSAAVLPTFADIPIGADPGSGPSAPHVWRGRAAFGFSLRGFLEELSWGPPGWMK